MQFTPTVSNTSNDLVNWTITGTTGSGACTPSTCGTLNAPATGTGTGFASTTYTAPATLPLAPVNITVTGTSAADPKQVSSTPITLVSSVTVTPNGAVAANVFQTLPFSATVLGPPVNQTGVTWSLTDAGGTPCTPATCGALTNITSTSVDYVAPGTVPNPATAILTATALFDGQKSNPPATITITPLNETGPKNRLTGRYAFIYRSYPNVTGTPVVEAGSLVFDGAGGVSGVEDDNNGTSPNLQKPVSGSYNIQSDGRGTLSLNSGPASNLKIVVLSTLDSTVASTAYLTGGATPGAGRMELQQDPTSLKASSLTGPFAVSLRGAAMPSAVGRFDLDGAGKILNAEIGRIFASSSFDTGTCPGFPTISPSSSYTTSSGTYPSISTTTGNVTLLLPTVQVGTSLNQNLSFSGYVVSPSKIFLVETDSSGFVFLGSVEQQTSGSFSASDFPGTTVYHFQSNNGAGAGNTTQGPVDSSGSGSLFEVEYFGNTDGIITPPTFNQDSSGSYEIQSNGTGLATFCPAFQSTTETAATSQIVMYMVSNTKSFAWNMAADATAPTNIADTLGEIDPQQGGPYTALSSLSGTFAFVFEGVDGTFTTAGGHTPSKAIAASGVVTFDGNGNATFTFDVIEGSTVTGGFTVNATYAFGADNDGDGQDADGYGLLTPTANPPFTFPEQFVVVSGSKIFFMHQGSDSNVGGVAELQ